MSIVKCKRCGSEWLGEHSAFCPGCIFEVMENTPGYFFTNQDTDRPGREIVQEVLRAGRSYWDKRKKQHVIFGEFGGDVVWGLPITDEMLERYKALRTGGDDGTQA